MSFRNFMLSQMGIRDEHARRSDEACACLVCQPDLYNEHLLRALHRMRPPAVRYMWATLP